MAKLTDIESIGEVYSAKLEDAGIASVENLLQTGGDKKGRKMLAESTGVSEKQLLNWVNRADLSRIKGVSTQYADLLEMAGVDTVPELAQRKPENLQAKMLQINEEKNLVRKVPTGTQVEDWIKQASEMPRMVNY